MFMTNGRSVRLQCFRIHYTAYVLAMRNRTPSTLSAHNCNYIVSENWHKYKFLKEPKLLQNHSLISKGYEFYVADLNKTRIYS